MSKYMHLSLCLLSICCWCVNSMAEEEAPVQKTEHEQLIDALLDKLSNSDECSSTKWGLLLKQEATPADVPVLVDSLKVGGKTWKQVFVSETLAKVGDRRAGDALRFEIKHGAMESKYAAISALGHLKSDWPVSTLVGLLRNPADMEVQKRAASSLGVIGSSRAIYGLQTTLSDVQDKPGVQEAVRWALLRAKREIDDGHLDTKFPEGRRVKLYFKGSRYYFYQPARTDLIIERQAEDKPRLLVCIHDENLRVRELFNLCWRTGKKRRLAVLAPYFDHMRFPEYGSLNLRGERADKRLLEILDSIGKNSSVMTQEVYLYGYNTGGDFVERFAMAYPERVARAAFDAYHYSSLDSNLCFPQGVGATGLAPDLSIDVNRFLKVEAGVILRTNSPSLRAAKAFVEEASRYAHDRGITSRIAVREVEVTQQNFEIADDYLFHTN